MSLTKRLKKFVAQSRRVLKVTKKPDAEEYKQITQVSLMGIGILGALGYILFILSQDSILGLPITAGLGAATILYLSLTQ